MSLFTLILQFTRDDARCAEEFLQFIAESPDVMRSYRQDETHYRQWLGMREKMKKGEIPPEPPGIKFRFHLVDHAEALRKRERKRKQ